MSFLKNRKPYFIENSRVPVILSKVAPIEIWAISFGFWVWCRGELSERTRRHETIHYQQQLELLLVGQWLLYGAFWLWGLVRYRDAEKAYRESPFEREAYRNDEDEKYLGGRPRFAWLKYV